MSESAVEASQPAQAAEAGRAGETPEQTIEALRAALAKANGEAKENRIKATELDKMKQSQLSDLERAQGEAESARAELARVQSEVLRWRIAVKHGISDADAETFLTGNDEETLTRVAERLASITTTASGTPKPDLTQGGQGTARALNSDGLEEALRAKLGIA